MSLNSLGVQARTVSIFVNRRSNFACRMTLPNPIAHLQRPGARTQPRQFGAISQRPGNLRKHGTAWWRTQSKSNPSQQQNSLITGNFCETGLYSADSLSNQRKNSMDYSEIPYGAKQGISYRVTGQFQQRTGKLLILSSRTRYCASSGSGERGAGHFKASYAPRAYGAAVDSPPLERICAIAPGPGIAPGGHLPRMIMPRTSSLVTS